MSACHYCGTINAECRPYGPKGEMICFACAFSTPERKRQTEQSFSAQLRAAGPVAVVGGEEGPYPIEHLVRSGT
jgi:hypothetical protein